jgi:hypothetical protein
MALYFGIEEVRAAVAAADNPWTAVLDAIRILFPTRKNQKAPDAVVRAKKGNRGKIGYARVSVAQNKACDESDGTPSTTLDRHRFIIVSTNVQDRSHHQRRRCCPPCSGHADAAAADAAAAADSAAAAAAKEALRS